MPDEPLHEKFSVPLSIVVQSSDPAIARSDEEPDPIIGNVRDLYTDRVQVNVYKRPEGVYTDSETGFVFDSKMVLDCTLPTVDDGSGIRYAFGTIKLEKSFEYRATAIAYAEQKNEDALFAFTGDGNFRDAFVRLTDDSQYTTPELFFGTLRYSDGSADNEVFRYKQGMEITGWLYRCVAGVELTLRDVPEDVTELALLAGSMNTECKAVHYSDFLTPDGKRDVPEEQRGAKFELTSWSRKSGGAENNSVTLKGANLLPVSSVLSVRFVKNGSTSVTTLRMKNNGDSPVPDNADDLSQGRINFQRNHYYQIDGDFEALVTQNLFLGISVNPNWEYDVDLTLDGK